MNDLGLATIKPIRAFLAGTEAIGFSMENVPERYAWIHGTLIRLRDGTLNKGDKLGV